MATYYLNTAAGNNYIDPLGQTWAAGSDANDGTSYTKPKLTWASTRTVYGNNDTIIIAPGKYPELFSTSTQTSTGVTVRGADPLNKPLIGATSGGHGIYCDDANFVFQDLKVQWEGATKSGLYLAGAGITLNRVEAIYPLSNSTSVLFLSANNITLNNCYLDSKNTICSSGQIVISGTGGVLNNTIILGSLLDATTLGICYCSGSGLVTITFNICLIGRNRTSLFNITNTNAATTITINNSILGGAWLRSASLGYLIQCNNTSIVNVNKSIITGHYHKDYVKVGTNVTLDAFTTSNIGVDPGLIDWPHEGIISITADDPTARVSGYNNLDYIDYLATKMESYGWRMSVFVCEKELVDGSSDSTEADLIANLNIRGHDIGIHGYSHNPQNYNHALHITYSGAGSNPTCTFDGTNITLTTNGATDQLIINTTTGHGTYVSDIINTYSGTSHWTIAKSTTDSQNASLMADWVKSTGFKTMTATAVPCDIDLLRTTYDVGYLKDELTDVKTWLETLIHNNSTYPDVGYTCKTYSAPVGAGDQISRNALYDLGIVAGRGGGGADSAIDNFYLGSIEILHCGAWADTSMQSFGLPGNDGGASGTVAEAALGAQMLAAWLCMNGGYYQILWHSYVEIDADEDTAQAKIDGILLALSKFKSLKVLSAAQMQAYLAANGWSQTVPGGAERGDMYWSKTLTANIVNRLRDGSPCINAGVDVGVTTDYAGTTRVGLDIGAYGYFRFKTKPNLSGGMNRLGGGMNQ